MDGRLRARMGVKITSFELADTYNIPLQEQCDPQDSNGGACLVLWPLCFLKISEEVRRTLHVKND